MAYWTWTN